jgi:hypothetical protein
LDKYIYIAQNPISISVDICHIVTRVATVAHVVQGR